MAIGWPLPVRYTSNHTFDHPVTTFLFAVEVRYEDGNFSSGGRGERSVPVSHVKKKCMSKFGSKVKSIDKHRTSQVCPDCKQRLYDVYVEDGAWRDPEKVYTNHVMGLKWCNNEDCKQKPLKNRDELACYNIFAKGEPEYHQIYDRAAVGSEYYWSGGPKIQTMQRYGMAASRDNGMAACGHHPANQNVTDSRRQKRKSRKRISQAGYRAYRGSLAYQHHERLGYHN